MFVKVVPAQQQMEDQIRDAARMKASVGIHVEETVFVNFPRNDGKPVVPENFVRDHLEIGKLCQMMMCPACCLYVPWAGGENKMEYVRNCGVCTCPYAVSLNDVQVGKVHDVGCCDNGAFFCCCPCLTCSGHVKLMGMDKISEGEKFVFAKKLFCCWPCVQACAMGCAPLGMCCQGMSGCMHYCEGTEFKKITQPVYRGPWKRSDGDPEQIGEFVVSQRFNPVCCCIAVPTPLKYYFKPTTQYGEQLEKENLAILSLVLQLYRGMPVPCKCLSPPGFQIPRGVSCMDIGLGTKTAWKTVQEIMKDSE